MRRERGITRLGALLGLSLVVCGATHAKVLGPSNPYEIVVERNVFGLKPPPAPPEPPKPPLPKITLTGMANILGKKTVLLKIPTPAAKPGAAPTERELLLNEGQRDGDLKVVKIDLKAATVDVVYDGIPMTLDFKDNGVQSGPVHSVATAPAPNRAFARRLRLPYVPTRAGL